MRQRQSNSTRNFLHVQCFMPKSWCLFVCRLCTLPGKERAGVHNPNPILVVAGLMLAAAQAGSNKCLNHLFQNIGR